MEQPVTATVSEIAAALGITDRAIRKRAKQWQPTGFRVQGGGDTYDIDTLDLRAGEAAKIKRYINRGKAKVIPLHPADDLQQSAEKERSRLEARAQSLEMFGRLPEWQQRGAKAKLAIIQACDAFIAAGHLAKTEGQNLFTHEYNLGRIEVAPWVRSEIREFHVGTLRKWISDEYERGMMGLVDLYGNRKDQSKIETYITGSDAKGEPIRPMVTTIKALILKYPHITEKKCNEALRGLLPDAPRVSNKSVRRFMDKWKEKNSDQFALAVNPDDFKNRLQPAFGSRSEGITGPNQLWEIDATPADLLLTDGERYKIIGVTDVGTARLKYYVTQTEKARDNLFAIRNCILDWGIPKDGTIATDEGSAYVGEHFRRVLSDLEIHHHICKPFSGDEKPHIERSFRTFSHDLIELTPGYCGHNVAERKAIESRKSFAQRLMKKDEVIEISVSAAELQAFVNRWCANYHNAVHSRLGKTPNQALAEWPYPIHVIPDERALDMLLVEAVRRGGKLPIVGKKGIRANGGRYIHSALHKYIGKHCRAFQDPSDLGRIIVHVMNSERIWEFLCIAEDSARTGISMVEVASATRALHNEYKKEITRLTRETTKALKGVDIVDVVMTYREKEAAEAQGNVTYFPRPTIEYTTPGLEAAAEAAAALDGKAQASAPVAPAPELTEMRKRLAEELTAPKKVINLETETDKQRYKRWKGLRDQLAAGEIISEEEYRFYQAFGKSATCRAFMGVEEDLGVIGK